jgi:hypothetical protein
MRAGYKNQLFSRIFSAYSFIHLIKSAAVILPPAGLIRVSEQEKTTETLFIIKIILLFCKKHIIKIKLLDKA